MNCLPDTEYNQQQQQHYYYGYTDYDEDCRGSEEEDADNISESIEDDDDICMESITQQDRKSDRVSIIGAELYQENIPYMIWKR